MKETTEYLIEYKISGCSFYRKSFQGFKDKTFTIGLAKNAIRDQIVAIRVVEQKRKVIKVFKPKETNKRDKNV